MGRAHPRDVAREEPLRHLGDDRVIGVADVRDRGARRLGNELVGVHLREPGLGCHPAHELGVGNAVRVLQWAIRACHTDTFIDYTKSLSRYFIATFKHLGGEVFAEDTYTQGAQDFSAQLQRIKALPKQPDVLYISSYMPDLGTIIKTIRAAGITTPIMGGDSYDDPQLSVVLGPDRGNDVFYATHSFMSADAGANVAAFLDLYKAEYQKDPDTAFVVTGWDVVNVMAEAMTKANSTDGAAMAKAMEGTEFTLLTGHLTWSDAAGGHRPDKEAVIAEISAGKTKFDGWFRPTWVPEP